MDVMDEWKIKMHANRWMDVMGKNIKQISLLNDWSIVSFLIWCLKRKNNLENKQTRD